LDEIPILVKAESIITSISVIPRETIGLARKEYTHLIWTIYLAIGAPTSGVGTVYEDDGVSTAYILCKSALTTTTYKIEKLNTSSSLLGREIETVTNVLTFTVVTEGTYDTIPSYRTTTVQLIHRKMCTNGRKTQYSRNVKVVFFTTSKSSLDGLGYRLRRANKAKATLDEIRMTPVSQTGQSSFDAYLMRAASSNFNLEYLAGSCNTLESFEKMIHLLDKEILSGAIQEVKELFNSLKPVPHIDEERLLIDTTIKNDIVEPLQPIAIKSDKSDEPCSTCRGLVG